MYLYQLDNTSVRYNYKLFNLIIAFYIFDIYESFRSGCERETRHSNCFVYYCYHYHQPSHYVNELTSLGYKNVVVLN